MTHSDRLTSNLGRGASGMLILLAVLLGGGVGLWTLLRTDTPPAAAPVSPASRPESASAPAAVAATQPMSRPVPVVAQQRQIDGPPPLITNPAQQKGMLRLPDGNCVPPLNGAVDPPAIQFRQGRPWSPIVGKGAGTWPQLGYLEYYIHADGTKTFTMRSPITRSGVTRMESVTLVSHPDESPGPRIPELAEDPAGGGTGTTPPSGRR